MDFINSVNMLVWPDLKGRVVSNTNLNLKGKYRVYSLVSLYNLLHFIVIVTNLKNMPLV